MEIDQAHAVVTGGGTGIGAEIVAHLLKAGARVSLMGRRESVLNETRERLDHKPGKTQGNKQNSQAIACDVTDSASVNSAFARATEQFGRVAILVNCAGAAPSQAFHKLSSDDWQQVINVNLNGVFNCTAAVINDMRDAKSGRIINIASTAALKGYAYVSAYSAAKHGVVGLTRSLALETAALGITVNAICPGYTDTDIIRNAVTEIVSKTGRSEEQALKAFTDTNPQQRLIQPAEVASTVLWLCNENSASVTGQSISISGGEVM